MQRASAAVQGQGDLTGGGGIPERLRDLCGECHQIDVLLRQLGALVELRQPQDVSDQREQTGGLLPDVSDKAGEILRLHQPRFDQVGAADDALQRRFQLMRHVGGKLPPQLLGIGLLGDVEGQQHAADAGAVGLDGAGVDAVFPPVPLIAELSVPARKRLPDGGAHGVTAVHVQEAVPDCVVRPEDTAGGGVDAEHVSLAVEQNESLVQVIGNLGEFVGSALQLLQPAVDFAVLPVDFTEQGRQLLIGVVFKGMLQVEAVQRIDDTLGEPPGQQAGQNQRHHHHEQQRLQSTEDQRPYGGLADRNAQHRAVRQPLGGIQRLFEQGIGIPCVASRAGGQRLRHLLAAEMVLHALGVGFGVKAHTAVRSNPGNAVAVGPEPFEVFRARLLHRNGCQIELLRQPVLLHGGKMAVQHPEGNREAGQQHKSGHQQDRAKNFPCHTEASHR